MFVEQEPKILICICTFNEIENLPDLVEKLQQHVPTAQILVVDDDSPDGTGDWSKAKSDQNDEYFTIIRKGQRGLGSATMAGMKFAIENRFDRIVTLDADFSHDPSDVPSLIADCQELDVVIGSRYIPGGRIEGWPMFRRIMSKLVNWFARIALRLKAKDCSGAFRNYRVEKLEEMGVESIVSGGYCYLEEILWRLQKSDASIDEVPIVFRDRTRGQTKINSQEAISAIWMMVRFGFTEWLGIAQPKNKN